LAFYFHILTTIHGQNHFKFKCSSLKTHSLHKSRYWDPARVPCNLAASLLSKKLRFSINLFLSPRRWYNDCGLCCLTYWIKVTVQTEQLRPAIASCGQSVDCGALECVSWAHFVTRSARLTSRTEVRWVYQGSHWHFYIRKIKETKVFKRQYIPRWNSLNCS